MVFCGFTFLAQTPPPLAEVRKAAEQGDATAQVKMGRAYFLGLGVPKDATEALKWYRKAAEQGEPNAQVTLGFMYEKGQGVAQDYPEAVGWYRKAAEQGNAIAQFNLGVMYDRGQGVAQDYPEAVRWYRKAAEQGNANAQFNLGVMYSRGRGVAQDYPEAVGWFRKAAEQGNAMAQYNLGVMYANGQGVAQDYPEAVRWYRKAAEQGNANAQFNLGLMCANGKGVTQNYVEAYMWLNLAASKFSGEEQKRQAGVRDALAKKITPQQIAEAELRAQEWKLVGPSPLGSTSPGPGSTENAGSAYRAPSPGAAQVSAPTAQDKVPPIAGAGAIECVRISNITSYKTAGGLSNKTSHNVGWWAGLDSTACKSFPFVARVTVHDYQDQGETMEVELPPGQERTLDFLIERNERITVHGVLGVSRKDLKESHFTGVHAQMIVADANVKALQEAQVTDPLFCAHYAYSRYTGRMTRYGPEFVPDASQTSCLKAKSTVMAERFMNEHAEVSSITKPILCADSACVQSHLDNTVPNATNVSKFIEGSNVYNAVRTFENVNTTCEKCWGHWTATGIMNQAMHISGPGRPDYDELDRYNFTCKTVIKSDYKPERENPYDKLPMGSVIPKRQTVAGKHSANDSYVTCSAEKIQ
jgi:hypothetical protein